MYNSINDFITAHKTCTLCDEDLSIRLNSANYSYHLPNVKQLYGSRNSFAPSTNTISTFTYDGGGEYHNTSKDYYYTILNGDKLEYHYESGYGSNRLVSIDMNTNHMTYLNKPVSEKLFVKHNLCLFMICNNEDCRKQKNIFGYRSAELFFGIKSDKIYPFDLNVEVLSINDYYLISQDNITRLYSPNKKIIATLPRISLYNKLGREFFINKIKVLTLFS